MSVFEKFFNRKVQDPAEHQKSVGGGSVSPEIPKQDYETIEQDQIWANAEQRLRIENVEPPRTFDYRELDETKSVQFYEDVAALGKKLEEGGFILEPSKKKGGTKTKTRKLPETRTPAPVSQVTIPEETPVTAKEVTLETVPVKAQETNGSDNVVALDAHRANRKSDKPLPDLPPRSDSAKTQGDAMKIEVRDMESAEDIINALAPEREALTEMMEGYWNELGIRVNAGWVTIQEEAQVRSVYSKSDRILHETLDLFKKEKYSVEDARKRLEEVISTLPIVEMHAEMEKGIQNLLDQENGAAEAEMIDETMAQAMQQYFESFDQDDDLKDTYRDWRENILPALERKMINYMSTISPKKKMNYAALQAILSNIAFRSK